MNNELKEIKKLYGEEMMHMCRELFPSILEEEGKLLSILKATIAPTHSFALDIKENNLYTDFKDWIYDLAYSEEGKLFETDKTPSELMEEAGYTLYECHSEEDIQSFEKYYAKGEELCTFNGGRLERCHVFFAVKKNVDEIKREDFPNPEREDEYGTSVISLQFDREGINTLSIKNRYNHTVNNPDATFGNNLEVIRLGLTYSFKKHYGFNFQRINPRADFLYRKIPYVQGNDLRVYRYNFEIYETYYCENNIIIRENHKIDDTFAKNKERYILFDNYLLDLKEKDIIAGGFSASAFTESINDVGPIKNIEVIKNEENRIIKIKFDEDKEVEIEIDSHNSIIGYENKYVEKIGDRFLHYSKHIKSINLPNVKEIGYDFLQEAISLEGFNLPEVQIIGDNFLPRDNNIGGISLPNVIEIGSEFLYHNEVLSYFNTPKLRRIGNNFLVRNTQMMELDLPNVTRVGNSFLSRNLKLMSIKMPKLRRVGKSFLCSNYCLKSINFPELEQIESSFIASNRKISSASLPKLKSVVDSSFLDGNRSLKELSLPEVDRIPSNFLGENTDLETIDLPKVTVIGSHFLERNREIKTLFLPKVEIIGSFFLSSNDKLEKIYAPKLDREVLLQFPQFADCFVFSEPHQK